MINREVLEKIRILEQKYKETWGINVDYTIISSGMTQEKLVDVLERIVDTGESVIVGFSNIKNKHYKHIFVDNILLKRIGKRILMNSVKLKFHHPDLYAC